MTTCRISPDSDDGRVKLSRQVRPGLIGSLLIGCLCFAPLFLSAGGPAGAAMGSGTSAAIETGDPDYDRGRAAFERADWAAVVTYMTRVVQRRPWHDDAYNALGFAHRKLGNFGHALSAYHRALQLNPHHRQALEYLGEAYLELDQPERARAVLARLRAACHRLAPQPAARDAAPDCEEWAELNAALERHGPTPAE